MGITLSHLPTAATAARRLFRHRGADHSPQAQRADASLRALLHHHQSNAAQFEMGAPAPLAHPAGARRRSAQRALVE